ncbi:MAG: 16S rRNA (guanine(966)-N(2))-methyltransferase RsmD [Crocinitomicaceae bacterium]|nr:16S rRNA (guanine(966)-N(2))-methyltransferase RsmD [Crocinitomicaceae bacterium]
MRIVSGKYKGKRFSPPKKFPSRPTTDFAKESLFNILENQLYWEDIKVLDLFAGTGNISVEMLSRGASSVLSVDIHPVCIRHLNKMQEELSDGNWRILKKDAFKFLAEHPTKYDLIFADPPFGLKGVDTLPDLVFEGEKLSQDGLLIIEHGKENDFSTHAHFKEVRNYGGVNFSFFSQ